MIILLFINFTANYESDKMGGNSYMIISSIINAVNNTISCHFNSVSHENPQALEYINSSIRRLGPKFDLCGSDPYNNSEIIKIKDISPDLDSEIYLIQLNLTLILPIRKAVNQRINCSVQEFDKNFNDHDHKVRMIEPKFFFKKLNDKNFEFELKKFGFYYFECLYRSNAIKKEQVVFKDIASILPQNMLKAIERDKTYEKFRKTVIKEPINDSLINPLLSDLNFTECVFSDYQDKYPKMNFFMMGFDSISFPNLRRILPKTYKYLTEDRKNDYLVYENMNIVGENTFPNIVPMLSGLIVEDNLELKLKGEVPFFRNIDMTFHDTLPFIFKNFHEKNYLTFYAEDKAGIGTFNYLKNGFR